MTPNRRLAAALLAGLVLLHVVGALAAHFWGALTSTLTSAQCGLLAWWMGFSRVRSAWKLAGWCSGTAFLFALLSHRYITDHARDIPWSRYEWIGYGGFRTGGSVPIVAAAAVALFLAAGWALRRRGLHLRTPFGRGDGGGAKVKLRRWQFGLGDLLLTTFAAAVTLGLIALTAPYRAWMLKLPAFWCEQLVDFGFAAIYCFRALDIVLVTSLAAWATLGTRLLSRRLAWVALVAAVWPLALATTGVAMEVYFFRVDAKTVPGLDMGELYCSLVQVSYRAFIYLFAFLASSFVVVRLAGCRLVRESRKGAELNDSSSGDRTEPDQSA